MISSTTFVLFDCLDDDLLSNIISYVGRNQYRFVATINQRFKEIYQKTFPGNTSTHWNFSTMAHIHICTEEEISPIEEEVHKSLCNVAAKKGNLSALQYFRSVHYPWDKDTCAYAARNGHFEVLKWCRQNGCPWDKDTCKFAAENGHLEVLQWCQQNGCPWDKDTCAYAARNGHFEVLKWCRQNGCPWNEWTCTNAACNGHFEVLKWCRHNGCPWDEYTSIFAALGGHVESSQWHRQNGFPCLGVTCKCAHLLDILYWCLHNGCPFNRSNAERINQYERWCEKNGYVSNLR